jgi:hypothetical protein
MVIGIGGMLMGELRGEMDNSCATGTGFATAFIIAVPKARRSRWLDIVNCQSGRRFCAAIHGLSFRRPTRLESGCD